MWPALSYYCQRTFLVLDDFDEATIPTDDPLHVREIRSREEYLRAPLPDGSAGLLNRMISSNRLCCRFLTVFDIASEGQTLRQLIDLFGFAEENDRHSITSRP